MKGRVLKFVSWNIVGWLFWESKGSGEALRPQYPFPGILLYLIPRALVSTSSKHLLVVFDALGNWGNAPSRNPGYNVQDLPQFLEEELVSVLDSAIAHSLGVTFMDLR